MVTLRTKEAITLMFVCLSSGSSTLIPDEEDTPRGLFARILGSVGGCGPVAGDVERFVYI
jgi:hypothetical protein